MAESLGDALLVLRTDDQQFTGGVARAEKQAEGLGQALDRTSNRSQTMGRNLAGAGSVAAAAGTQFGAAADRVTASAGAQRAGMQQLSMQLNDVATMYALGARPMQIFASQSGQVVQAVQLMSGGTSKLARFLGGPWGLAMTTAAIVLVPLISNLLSAEDAMEKVEFASDKLGDAESILGSVFDRTTGKIKANTAALLENNKAKAIAGQFEAAKRLADARGQLRDLGQGEVNYLASGASLYSKGRLARDRDPVADIARRASVGMLSADQAINQLRALPRDDAGTNDRILKALSSIGAIGVERSNIEVMKQLEKALNGDKSAMKALGFGPEANPQKPTSPGNRARPKRPEGPDAAEVEARFNDELVSYTQRTLSAMERQATNAEDQAEYRQRGVELARIQTLEDIKANEDYSAAQKQRLTEQVEELADWERKGIELDKQVRLEAEQSALASDRHQEAIEALQLQADMADTQQDRKRIALELFALEERYQASLLEAVIASETATDAEKKRAELALAGLQASASARRDSVARGNETDVERFLREVNKTPAQMDEALDGVVLDGLQSLNDQLANAIVNFESLGDVAQSILKQILLDLLRLQIQQAIIGPLAGMLGLGGGGGGLLGAAAGASAHGGIGSVLGSGGLNNVLGFAGFRAKGGLIPSGQFGIVGERGPEPVIGTSRGAMVLPNRRLGQFTGGGENGGSRVTVNQSYILPSRADPRRTESSVARGTQMGLARASGKRIASPAGHQK